jgi:hypothetical protein
MASTSSPYGLRPINLIGGQGYSGSTRLYAIPSNYSVAIQYGDPVIIVNTGSTRGTVARFSATTTAATETASTTLGLVGVFMGCTYTDPVLGKTFRQNYTGSIVASDIQAYCVTDPDALFQVQANGTLGQTALGTNASIIQTVAGSTNLNTISGVGLKYDSINSTNTLPLTIVDFVNGPLSTLGDAFTDVIVRINTHFNRTGATGRTGVSPS